MAGKVIIRKVADAWPIVCKRNLGVSAVVMQKALDPIQQLFLTKLNEYKKKSSDPKFLDQNPDIKKAILDEEKRILNVYGGSSPEDMNVFPAVKFTDPVIDAHKNIMPNAPDCDLDFVPTEVPPEYLEEAKN